ncbi:SRPBCC family protein [Mesorhizobium sp. ES1-4]|uniref:SRPBCC family protein n=1 Tax=Mesorhizobium sp. ES1-4 TaxID=2876627 RepID=UPI001CCA5BC3|nr:SRPBCC family protein [Mesorhizobium sp. ES1-4]MBZ9797229.1 hypothetical protein [Mesorhizobium sp. ES1-4]
MRTTQQQMAEALYINLCVARQKRDVFPIYTDNSVEGYHIPGTHPSFYAAIDFEAFQTTAHPGYVRMTAPPKDGLFYRGKWLWMWPNWTLSLFDGGMNVSRINPTSPHHTDQHYHFFFADIAAEASESRAKSVQGTLAVVREDYTICADTHRNYAAGAYSSARCRGGMSGECSISRNGSLRHWGCDGPWRHCPPLSAPARRRHESPRPVEGIERAR